jgi:hypothetical protein
MVTKQPTGGTQRPALGHKYTQPMNLIQLSTADAEHSPVGGTCPVRSSLILSSGTSSDMATLRQHGPSGDVFTRQHSLAVASQRKHLLCRQQTTVNTASRI